MNLRQSGFRRTRHMMHICLRPESHNAGFESELNLQKTATNINFRYFEKKRFCQTSTKFCQTSYPPNLMPRNRRCAFIFLPATSIPLNWLEKEPLCQKLSPLFWCSDQLICLSHASHFVGLVKESQYHQFNQYLVI